MYSYLILQIFVHRINLTSDEPSWTVRGLEWDIRFRLVALAVNSKGRSPPARLADVLFRDPEKRTGESVLSGLVKIMRHQVILFATVTIVLKFTNVVCYGIGGCGYFVRQRKNNRKDLEKREEVPTGMENNWNRKFATMTW